MKTFYSSFIFSLIIFLSNSFTANAADYYWKGGSGDFNDPTMWWIGSFASGTTAIQAPISTDNVFFSSAAFNSPGNLISLTGPSNCQDLIFDNTIPLVNAPTFSASDGIFLDVYGSMSLAENMTFDFKGTLRFRSTAVGLQTLHTRDHKFLLKRLDFDGGPNTEFRLMDDLYVDDPSQNNNTLDAAAGTIYLLSGFLNLNAQTLRTDFFISRNNNPDRGLNFSNSQIYVGGRSNVQRSWFVDFNSSTQNYTIFDANNSHIIFNQTVYNSGFQMGTRMAYDSISSLNTPLLFWGNTDTMSIVNLGNGATLQPHNTRLTIDTLYLAGNLTFFGISNSLTVDDIVITPSCDYTTITRNVYGATIKKKNVGVLNLSNVILIDIDGDITDGSTYNALNSIDIGTNTNWNFTNPLVQDLYFRDGGDNNWHNVNNWSVWNGFTFGPASCIPSPADNVYFDDLSFPNPNQSIIIDSTAYCHDMRWLNNINNNDELFLGNNIRLNVFGTLQLNNKMAPIARNGSNTILFWGSADSIISDDIPFYVRSLRLKRYADYQIADDLIAHNFGSDAGGTIRTDNVNIDLKGTFTTAHSFMDSTYVTIETTEYNAFTQFGGTTNYSGTTTFHFKTAALNRIGLNTVLPNVIMDSDGAWGYGFHTIQGDLTVNANMQFYSHPNFRTYINVTGSMSLYNGDMNLAPGYQYIVDEKIQGANTGGLEVAGTLNALGTCTDIIILTTQTGQSTPFKVGNANIQYALITGMNNSGNPTITTSNSVDNGGNVNWNFTPTTGTTYYWRADATNNTDFEGNWENPNHWTTNSADLTGTLGGCIPTIEDDVIFDSQSFSATSNGCFINKRAFCKSLRCLDDISLNHANNHFDRLYVGGDFILYNNMTNYNFTGLINFIGSGNINTNGTTLNNRFLSFNNPLGTWNILSDIHFFNTPNFGFINHLGGTINTNNYNIDFNYFRSINTTNPRILNLGSSILNVRRTWTLQGSSTFTILPGTSTINLLPFTGGIVRHDMGDNINYHRVIFSDSLHNQITVQNDANYHFAEFYSTTYITGNNSFDTLQLHGGTFTYLTSGTTQTLSAPYGTIIVDNDAGPSNFVNIESNPTGSLSYFHKEYGSTFCLDWIKIKDNEATKGIAPPPAWAGQHNFLQFETGSNSDNVNGTATGIWAFNLPPILTINAIHPDSLDLCAGGSTVNVPLSITGTYPYSIIYTWIDAWGMSGIDTVIVEDNDSTVTTPFVYNLELHPQTNTDYTIDIAALRCGERNYNAPISNLHIGLNDAAELVAVNSQGTCTLENNNVWTHFTDITTERPMLSILDSTNISDMDSLGTVDVQTNFDPTVQYWAGHPYLQRHWKVDPQNTIVGGKVRLYFTQMELDALTAHTFVAGLNRSLNPATELVLLKFEDTITVGIPTSVPFTVIPLTGIAADPFNSINNIIAIEFEVSSFSGFLLQPTTNALLPLTALNFEAQLNNRDEVDIHWTTLNESELSHYELQKSSDAVSFDNIASFVAKNDANNHYAYTDLSPYASISYYRLKIIDNDQNITYSAIRAIERQGTVLTKVYPVPAQQDLFIDLSNHTSTEVSLELVNTLGQIVLQQNHNISVGKTRLRIPVHRLTSGQYILNIHLKDQAVLHKKVILK